MQCRDVVCAHVAVATPYAHLSYTAAGKILHGLQFGKGVGITRTARLCENADIQADRRIGAENLAKVKVQHLDRPTCRVGGNAGRFGCVYRGKCLHPFCLETFRGFSVRQVCHKACDMVLALQCLGDIPVGSVDG